MVRTAIQLYSLRSMDESLPSLLDRVAGTAFEGVEFAGLGDAGVAQVAAALDETGLEAAGAHVGIEALEGRPDEASETYSKLGCRTMVVPHLGAEHFTDDPSIRVAARRLNDLARRLDQQGVRLCYHNHDQEFTPVGGGPALDVLVESLDEQVGIELDVGWVQAAGHDPVAVLDRLDGRVPLVHVKDVDSDGRPVDLGDGVVDVDACVEAARGAGTAWLIFEHDDPVDPVSSLERGGKTLASLRDRFAG